MKQSYFKKLVVAAMLLALGTVLPLITMQIKEIGDSLLPMHFTVLLCGFICGYKYGLAVGILTPVLRAVIFGMPPLYPNALYMAAELAVYGLITGLLFFKLKIKNYTLKIYLSLVSAMLIGRIVWGIAKAMLLGAAGKTFTFALFISGGFLDAMPGIILQLILIPIIMNLLNKEKII